jgi:hypothetical protein
VLSGILQHTHERRAFLCRCSGDTFVIIPLNDDPVLVLQGNALIPGLLIFKCGKLCFMLCGNTAIDGNTAQP